MTSQMIHILSTIKGTMAIAGIAAFSTGVGVLADVSASELGQETHITLGSALSVGAVVVLMALYVGRWQSKVDGRLKNIETRLDLCQPSAPCHPKKKH